MTQRETQLREALQRLVRVVREDSGYSEQVGEQTAIALGHQGEPFDSLDLADAALATPETPALEAKAAIADGTWRSPSMRKAETPASPGVSELQRDVAAETTKAVECREERQHRGDAYQVKYWGGFLDALGFVSLKLNALLHRAPLAAQQEVNMPDTQRPNLQQPGAASGEPTRAAPPVPQEALRGEDTWLDEFVTAAISGTGPQAEKGLLRNCLRICLRAFAANYKRQLATQPAASEWGRAIYVAVHFDPEQKGWPRVAGVYSSYEASEKRVEELGGGATQSLTLDKPVRFTFEAQPASTPAEMENKS